MALTRRMTLLSPVLLSCFVLEGCGDDAPPRDFPPIRYDYLTRLQLNVGAITYGEPPPPGRFDAISPVPLGPALRQLAQDRLTAGGATGAALVTIEDANIVRGGDGLDGSCAIRLDISGAEGKPAGFAEARVTRHVSDPGRDLRGALYDMTKQMLDDMNVELEFQIRRSLRDVLQSMTVAPAPAAVQQQDLGAPSMVP